MHRSEGPLRYMAVDDNHLASLLVSAIAASQTKQTNDGKAMGDPLCANLGFSPAPVFLVAKNFGTINTSDSLATRQKKSVSCIISALYHLAHYTHQSSAKTAPLSLAAVVFFLQIRCGATTSTRSADVAKQVVCILPAHSRKCSSGGRCCGPIRQFNGELLQNKA